MPRLIQGEAVEAWCERWLGAKPIRILFEVVHLSRVTGLRLTDGRAVVVKVRPPAERIQACVHVQRHLWAVGFPCPEPLAGPQQLGTMTATAEAFVPGGTRLEPGADSPRLFAEALAELVRLTPPVTALPTLAPPPAWVFWDHDQPSTWPLPDDRDGSVSKVEIATPMGLIYKVLFPSISTFETPPTPICRPSGVGLQALENKVLSRGYHGFAPKVWLFC